MMELHENPPLHVLNEQARKNAPVRPDSEKAVLLAKIAELQDALNEKSKKTRKKRKE